MKTVKDIRKVIDPNFTPQTKEIQGVELGDIQSRTVQDIYPTPPNRSKISTVVTKED